MAKKQQHKNIYIYMKRVKVVKVVPNVAPDTHEIVLHVEAPEPPPAIEEAAEFHEPLARTAKKRGFWSWLLGGEEY
jgi:hypothetical protein